MDSNHWSLSRVSRFILRKVNCGGIDEDRQKNFAGYRWFESISLQRGVHCETDFCRQSLLSGGPPAAGSSLITIQESLLRSRLI